MNPIQDILNTTIENLKTMTGVKSVVGDPITTPDGTVIIPVSKLSFGVGAGGSDISTKEGKTGFGGGSGAGATVNPMAFLIINNGNVRIIPIGPSSSPVDKLVDMVPEAIDKVSDFFADAREKKAAKAEQE